MNSNLKIAMIAGFVGLIAGISIATIDTATAQMLNPTHPDVTRLSPKSFGAATAGIVCGDRLCNDPSPDFDIEEDMPIGLAKTPAKAAIFMVLFINDRFSYFNK